MRPARSSLFSISVGVLVAVSAIPRAAAAQPAKSSPDTLDAFSNAVESMVQRVSPAVVQVLVSRYASREQDGRSDVVMGWEQSIGSGVLVGSDGYIITNAHVVDHAQQIKVRLVSPGAQTVPRALAESYVAPRDATLVGAFDEADLALLKISGEGFPVLTIAGLDKVRHGQIVFAFGSPQGLQNSVTMGVVSSVARQLDPDSPFLYIQTDAPINPGNSGGPLVNTSGEMVGLDTFISTQSGGSEGIGFAVPGALVRFVYDQLRKYGHVHRPVIGVGLQTITPPLAAALKLSRSEGVLVSDILADSPAASAGLKLNDILLTVDGRSLDNVAAMTGVSFTHAAGAPMKVQVLRGTETLSFDVIPADVQDDDERVADLADLSNATIPSLGIVGVTLDEHSAAAVSSLRLSTGVVVVARTGNPRGPEIDLRAGDVLHEVNGKYVTSAEDLRAALASLKSGDPVAIQVERDGRWFYVAFNLP